MYAGLDVGGTHTDAVLVEAATGRCLASAKAVTRGHDVLPGILEALERLFTGAGSDQQGSGRDPKAVRRLTVSTTLGLNALLTGNTDPVGMLVLPGPGMDPALFWGPDPLFRVLPGAQDHRGRIMAAPEPEDLAEAFAAFKKHGAKALGIVCKFSPKNPEMEQTLAEAAAKAFGPDMPVVLGASCGGSLNFPRRMHTVWCNAALAAVSGNFVRSLAEAVRAMGFSCPLAVLKADAGSFSAQEAALDPAGTMGSGPAASLLGVWALSRRRAGATPLADEETGDTVMIDMGGTSTDIALLAGGYPLLARQGLTAAGRPTLIPALWTTSLALGGDSSLRARAGRLGIGPDRSGPALSLDEDPAASFSRPPTLTDALNVLGLAALGDTTRSRAALGALAASPDCPEEGRTSAEALAGCFVQAALERIGTEIASLLADVNARPVYTIRELLLSEPLAPRDVVFIGGPAQALTARAEQVLGLPVRAPEESAFANALGAALARPTKSAELYADTLLGRMTIPDFGVEKAIGKDYRLEDAKADIMAAFASAAEGEAGPSEVRIAYAESFAMLDDRGGRGRTLRVRAQRAAGLDL